MEFALPPLIVRQTQVEADEVERDSGYVDRDGDVDREGDRGTLSSLCDQPLWDEAVLDGDSEENDDAVETDNGRSSVVTGTRVPLPSTTASTISSHTYGDMWAARERHPPAAVVIGHRLGRGEEVKRAVAANSRSSRLRQPLQRTRREERSLGNDGRLRTVRTMSNKVRHLWRVGREWPLYSAIIVCVVSTESCTGVM